MMYKLRFLFLLLLLGTASSALACDFCAVYNSVESSRPREDRFNLGIVHQFTHYESNVRRPEQEGLPGQHLESNVTQFVANYGLSDRFSLQINLPLIYRDFRRIRDGVVDEGSESGLGDIALSTRYQLYRQHTSDSALRWDISAGVKLPTGDSDRLAEVRDSLLERRLRHGGAEGELVSGDFLALGSGSYDWLVSTNFFGQFDRFLVNSSVQYTLKQEGDFDYRYGNDLQWSVSPGYYLLLSEENTLSARARISGETKDQDKFRSQKIDGSQDTRMFLGPELAYTIGDAWFLSLGWDFALLTESASDGVTPRHRLNFALIHKL